MKNAHTEVLYQYFVKNGINWNILTENLTNWKGGQSQSWTRDSMLSASIDFALDSRTCAFWRALRAAASGSRTRADRRPTEGARAVECPGSALRALTPCRTRSPRLRPPRLRPRALCAGGKPTRESMPARRGYHTPCRRTTPPDSEA